MAMTSSTGSLVCWRCGGSLASLPLPLGRRDECPACHAELHVCRLCRHYDPGKAKQCRELAADEVKNKDRANFCDWFQPRPGAGTVPAASPTVSARTGLEALFGEGETHREKPAGSPRQALDDLFGD